MTPEKEIREGMVNEPDMGHEYDGIRELDHRLPNWWQATFYLSIVFAFAYWAYFHIMGAGPLQMERYEQELARAEAAAAERAGDREAISDELLLAYSADEGRMASGQQTYTQFCAACHGAQGEGGIGANLTDEFWIHGGAPLDILKVVSEGVPTAGMPAWRSVLGEQKTEEVAAFVLSLRGKNLPGKEAQGERWEE